MNHPRPPKIDLWLNCGRVFLRPIKREDASDRWAGWMADPHIVHVTNPKRTQLTRKELLDYIRSFDQRTNILLGIFERVTRTHVGIIRLDLDDSGREALVSALIGEPAFRNTGTTTFVFEGLLNYLFNERRLDRVVASVLERNSQTRRYLARLGWAEEGGGHSGGPQPLNTVRMSVSRAQYECFRASPLGQRLIGSIRAAQASQLR